MSLIKTKRISKSSELLSILLVKYLKKDNCLLQRSHAKKIKNKKNIFIKRIKKEYKEETQLDISEKTIFKKLANMKCRVKKKVDNNKLSHKKIILRKWESDLMHLMTTEPHNITYNSSKLERFSPTIIDNSFTSSVDTETRLSVVDINDSNNNGKASVFKKYETNETENLNYEELQRLILLKQNKVLSLKIKRLEGNILRKYDI